MRDPLFATKNNDQIYKLNTKSSSNGKLLFGLKDEQDGQVEGTRSVTQKIWWVNFKGYMREFIRAIEGKKVCHLNPVINNQFLLSVIELGGNIEQSFRFKETSHIYLKNF